MTEHSSPFPRRTAFVAAALVAAAVGAVSGQAIGDTPILRDRSEHFGPSANKHDAPAERSAETDRPPDHYPLVTPNGTIPVAELALHGRMRDRNDGWYAVEETVLFEASYDDDLSEAEIGRLARHTPLPEVDDRPAPSPRTVAERKPFEDAESGMRIVDVPAALDEAQDL